MYDDKRDSFSEHEVKADDKFVGVRVENGVPKIYFPMGYRLSSRPTDARRDIRNLIDVLGTFAKNDESSYGFTELGDNLVQNFPISAYLIIIEDYLSQGYYFEKEPHLSMGVRGKIDWSRTFRNHLPFIQKNGSPIYSKFTVKISRTAEDQLITNIHKYCVYQSFQRLGWLFTSQMPSRPSVQLNAKLFLAVLYDKLQKENNDRNKLLFRAMISLIREEVSPNSERHSLTFGVNEFWPVWESLVDYVFGDRGVNKQDYFPRAQWQLGVARPKATSDTANPEYYDSSSLRPDTIMHIGNLDNKTIFILDAKYYPYGCTLDNRGLPNSSSIHKQITYGEFVEHQFPHYGNRIYNAFIMPYDKNCPKGMNWIQYGNNSFVNIGEAAGIWRTGTRNYEHVQGILVDVKALMDYKTVEPASYIRDMAAIIEHGRQHWTMGSALDISEMVFEN